MIFKRFLTSMGRPLWTITLAWVFILAASTTGRSEQNEPPRFRDYSELISLMEMHEREEPLIPFGDFEVGYHRAIHRRNLRYFREHPRLLQRIRGDLDSEDVRWELQKISHRLLFVPESRILYADLFGEYCREVIRETLSATGLENPYCEIRTLAGDAPADFSRCPGVTALVVHNLAEEYVATYLFSSGGDKKVRIHLNGTFYVGAVGSYTSSIVLDEEGRFVFERNDYTVWQNSARKPFSALAVPIEETVHISLRDITEGAIRNQIKGSCIRSLREVRSVVEEWMAVEEAVAGGVAYVLAPEIIMQYVPALSKRHIQEELDARTALARYRYLKTAVDVIRSTGARPAIELYRHDPAAFREILVREVQGCEG